MEAAGPCFLFSTIQLYHYRFQPKPEEDPRSGDNTRPVWDSTYHRTDPAASSLSLQITRRQLKLEALALKEKQTESEQKIT